MTTICQQCFINFINFSTIILFMKLLLEVEDKKAPALLEVLKGLSFVKTKKVKKTKKESVLKGLKEAIEEVNLAKEGKIKLKSFDEFLNEL